MSIALDALIFATAWGHVLLAPYTKVEESFNLHAAHDVLMYGVTDIHNYDHLIFPGAVPRTFIGSVLLAWITIPVAHLAHWAGYMSSKFDMQILLRLVLASLNAWTLSMLRRATSRRFGRTTGLFFSILSCTQFHLPFWMGRTIPNMLAMIPFNIATYLLLDRAPNAAKPSHDSIRYVVALLVFASAILRAEVALLLGPLCLQMLYRRQISFMKLLIVGLISGLASVLFTVAVDSYFWGYIIWPELFGIYFNVVKGKSAEWGTSPPWTYFVVYLPKLLLGSLPLALIGIASDHRIRSFLLPSVLFIVLISGLGHKEWRFIIYVVPAFNIAAARGARYLVSRKKNTLIGRVLFLVAIAIPLANLTVTALLTRASMTNYPGGQAMASLHRLRADGNIKHHQVNTVTNILVQESPVNVHISNLAAQTGASLFTQLHAPPYFFDASLDVPSWIYDKTENMTTAALLHGQYTHLIVEEEPRIVLSSSKDVAIWRVADAVKGFNAWVLDWPALQIVAKGKELGLTKLRSVLYVKEDEKLWILERQS